MTTTPSVREILARAICSVDMKAIALDEGIALAPGGLEASIEKEWRNALPNADAALEALAKAGLAEEQLNAILRGEAEIVPIQTTANGKQFETIKDVPTKRLATNVVCTLIEAEGNLNKYQVLMEGLIGMLRDEVPEPQASQESGDAKQDLVRSFNEWVPAQESGDG